METSDAYREKAVSTCNLSAGPSGLYEKPVQLSGELQAQRKTVSKIEVESNQRDN